MENWLWFPVWLVVTAATAFVLWKTAWIVIAIWAQWRIAVGREKMRKAAERKAP
jgi:hypothetical protein